ncbi:MAG TPA: tetratricopeptide repeat protein [Candidatus Binatia bacterium]|nr:tetratricopeptide repeat protein [Candidatus Binatia bacterium]
MFDDDPVSVLNDRAIEAIRAGQRESAVALLADALVLDERSVRTIVNVGNMLLEDGAVDEAIVHYEAALRLDDRYAPAHHNLGVALRRRGDRAASVRHLRRATRLEITAWVSRRRRRRA